MTEHFCTTCNRLRLSTVGRAARLPRVRRRRRPARSPARRGARRGRRGDTRRARGQTPRPHLPAHRARRSAQSDGTNRRMIDGARLKQRIADLAPAFEERLAALCGIPSVSMDPGRRAEMAACAKLGADMLREAGAQVDTIDTGGFPMVVGRFIQDPSFPTVTVYNHLDVQPADGEGWRTPPFKLTRDASGAAGPVRWFARGSTDDKGPALTALYGARLAIENGVRANIQFLWELEEEIGSPHFAAGLAAAVAGDAADRARAAGDRFGGRLGHDLDRGGPAVDLVRPARADGLHGGARDRREGRSLRDHRGPRAQSDRRARGAGGRVLRRAHRQGEDPGLLRRRAQAVGRRAQGVRARTLLAQAVRRRARAPFAAADPRRPRRPGRADRGADARGARPRRRLRGSRASRPSFPTAPS